jgi:hypothetical protein
MLALGVGAARAATGTWQQDADGNWSDASKWSGGVPNGNADQALLIYDLTANRTVTVDVAVTVSRFRSWTPGAPADTRTSSSRARAR